MLWPCIPSMTRFTSCVDAVAAVGGVVSMWYFPCESITDCVLAAIFTSSTNTPIALAFKESPPCQIMTFHDYRPVPSSN